MFVFGIKWTVTNPAAAVVLPGESNAGVDESGCVEGDLLNLSSVSVGYHLCRHHAAERQNTHLNNIELIHSNLWSILILPQETTKKYILQVNQYIPIRANSNTLRTIHVLFLTILPYDIPRASSFSSRPNSSNIWNKINETDQPVNFTFLLLTSQYRENDKFSSSRSSSANSFNSLLCLRSNIVASFLQTTTITQQPI